MVRVCRTKCKTWTIRKEPLKEVPLKTTLVHDTRATCPSDIPRVQDVLSVGGFNADNCLKIWELQGDRNGRKATRWLKEVLHLGFSFSPVLDLVHQLFRDETQTTYYSLSCLSLWASKYKPHPDPSHSGLHLWLGGLGEKGKRARLNNGIGLCVLTPRLAQLWGPHCSYRWTAVSPLIYLFIFLSSIKPTYFSSVHQTLIASPLCGSHSGSNRDSNTDTRCT